jgi:hypothetical protein
MYHYYIISGLCLVAFYMIYIFVLSKEKSHRFNRFYLLSTLLLSLIIPFIDLSPALELSAISTSLVLDNIVVNTVRQFNSEQIVANASPRLSIILLLYFSVTAILLFRFMINFSRLAFMLRHNQRINYRKSILILMDKPIPPFTFLYYVFINREDYLSGRIDNLLIEHELAHVKQKHSIDIILIELSQAFLWLNPILIFYKKAIKLNHEFLADSTVLQSSNNPIYYQNLLVRVSSIQLSPYFTNSFNSSLTKKRLTMISKTKSPAWLAISKKFSALLAVGIVSLSLVFAQAKMDKKISFKGTWEYSQKDFIGTKTQSTTGQMTFKNVTMIMSNKVDSMKLIRAELASRTSKENNWIFKNGEVKSFDQFGKEKASKFDVLEIVAISDSANSKK